MKSLSSIQLLLMSAILFLHNLFFIIFSCTPYSESILERGKMVYCWKIGRIVKRGQYDNNDKVISSKDLSQNCIREYLCCIQIRARRKYTCSVKYINKGSS